MPQVRIHHRRTEKKKDEPIDVEEATVEADLSKTDELLDRIEEVLEDQEKIEFKEKLRRWAENQQRLSPSVEMFKMRRELYEVRLSDYGFNKDCPCCGLPLNGPPGPECLSKVLS